jgi:hypothetical protein
VLSSLLCDYEQLTHTIDHNSVHTQWIGAMKHALESCIPGLSNGVFEACPLLPDPPQVEHLLSSLLCDYEQLTPACPFPDPAFLINALYAIDLQVGHMQWFR